VRKVFIVLDALDECEKRDEMLEFLKGLQEDEHDLVILVTSRGKADIAEAFDEYPRLDLNACRRDLDQDIHAYIEVLLAQEPRFQQLPAPVKADIKASLVGKTAGMYVFDSVCYARLNFAPRFRWAQCQLDALARQRTIKSMRTSLGRLPDTLNETYANILRKVENDDIDLLRRALLWTAFAVMPLTLEELQEAIAIEPGVYTYEMIEEARLHDPKDILRLGSSLLYVTEAGHVKLGHLSVLDYLQSEEIKSSSDVGVFALNSEDAKQEMAKSCLTYLFLDSIASGPVDARHEWDVRFEQHPLFEHASVSWPYYLRGAASRIELNDLAYDFFSATFRRTFFSWIQRLNSDWIHDWNEYPRHATPLYYAASFGLKDSVKRLVEDGVELDAQGSRFGGTALHGATLREHISIVRWLLKAGADPSRADFNEITPLHIAASGGDVEAIKLLLQHGASLEAVDSYDETPYDWAKESGQEDAKFLLREEQSKALAHSSQVGETVV
jgi:hypothetical protein